MGTTAQEQLTAGLGWPRSKGNRRRGVDAEIATELDGAGSARRDEVGRRRSRGAPRIERI